MADGWVDVPKQAGGDGWQDVPRQTGPAGGPGGAAKAPVGSAARQEGSSLSRATSSISSGPGGAVQGAMAAQHAPISPIEDSSRLPDIADTAVASLPKDPANKATILAKSLFPDLSPNEALKRMGFDGQRFYYIADDGKPYFAEPSWAPLVAPGQTLRQAPDIAASNIGPSLPIIGGVVGGFVGGPEPASVVTAAGGGMLGESIRQAGADLLAGEEVTPGLEPYIDLAKEGALQGANQAVGLGVGTLASKAINANPLKVAGSEARALTPARVAEVEANANLARGVGIPVTPGEAGNIKSLLANQRQLLRYPESSTQLSDFYAVRNTEQIPDAWVKFLDNEISPAGAPAIGNRNLQDAAGEVIDSAVAARKAAAEPEYKAVMRADNVLSPHDFNNLMSSNPLFPMAVQAVRRDPMLEPKIPAGASDASLPVLDLAKRWLDDQAGKFARAGDNTRASSASDAAALLRNELDPLFPGYQAARDAFAGASPEVAALQDGIVGMAAKDRASGLQGVSRTLFSAQSADPVSVSQARQAFQKAGKLDEWNAGLRAFMQNTFDDAARQQQGPAPALWQNFMADARQRDTLRAAMTPNQWVAFNDLMKVIEMVKRAPAEGSPTATDLGAREAFAGPIAKGISKAVNFPKWPQAIDDAITQWSAGRNIGGMVDVITDPNAVAILRRVQTLTPGTQRWIDEVAALGLALGYTGGLNAKQLPPPSEPGQLPPPKMADGGIVTDRAPSLKEFLAGDPMPFAEKMRRAKEARRAQAAGDGMQRFAKGGVVLNASAKPQSETAGRRDEPVRVTSAADIAAAGKHADQKATPGQKEAGNYQHGHCTWCGLSVTLETPKGGTRKAKDGSWEVKDFPAHYGYVKRTKGADNEHVDVFMGDHPESKRVWIIDQIDPKTRRFDEHKVMLACSSAKQARDLYCAAFSDGSGPKRIGAFTMMSIDQFKGWLKRGKRTKAVGKLPSPTSAAKAA